MPKPVQDSAFNAAMEDVGSTEMNRQGRGFQALTAMTREPVPWAYEVWDQLVELAKNGDNRQRSIAGQLLSGLAKSDLKGRMLKSFTLVLGLTRDERFVTARHVLLSLWKIAVVSPRYQKMVVDGLISRFKDCADEKNATLIRYDIQCVLRKISDASGDASLRLKAEALFDLEPDPKYRKKYAAAWRGAAASKSCN